MVVALCPYPGNRLLKPVGLQAEIRVGLDTMGRMCSVGLGGLLETDSAPCRSQTVRSGGKR